MPYIAIKGFPKDDATMRKVTELFNKTLLELWGCPQEGINISYEAAAPEEWDERMEYGEIAQRKDKMLICRGKELYKDAGNEYETIKTNAKRALDAVP